MPFEASIFGSVCSGPEEIRGSARTFLKYGVDHLKINLSGEYIAGLPAEMSPFSAEAVAMQSREAKRYGKRMAAHARSSESVKLCARHGIEMVYHASFADAQALDMHEAAYPKEALLTDLAKIQLVMKDRVIDKECATPTPTPKDAALHLEGADFPLREEGVKGALAEMAWALLVPSTGIEPVSSA